MKFDFTEIKITQNKRMMDNLSKRLFYTPEKAMHELLQNARDADAQNVWLTFGKNRADKAILTIIDDGIGFDPKRMCAYCEQATDYKEQNRITPGGRTSTGYMGIGRHSCFSISKKTTITTRSDVHPQGQCSRFAITRSNFTTGRLVKFEHGLKWSGNTNTGTIIVFESLSKSFLTLTDERLRRFNGNLAMNWDLEEFNIYVNDEKLCPESVEYEPYCFREYKGNSGSLLGKDVYIKGQLGLMKKAGKINGVTIRVLGEAIMTSYFGLEKKPKFSNYLTRLRGVIQIDALSSIINLGRDGFTESDERYKIVDQFVQKTLIEILEERIEKEDRTRKKKADKAIKLICKEVNKILSAIFNRYKAVYKSKQSDAQEDDDGIDVFQSKNKPEKGSGDDIEENEDEERVSTRRKQSVVGGSGRVKAKQGENHIKWGDTYWSLTTRPLGSNQILILALKETHEALVNTDHPSYKHYESRIAVLIPRVFVAINNESKEFSVEYVDAVIDDFDRDLPRYLEFSK